MPSEGVVWMVGVLVFAIAAASTWYHRATRPQRDEHHSIKEFRRAMDHLRGRR